MICEVCGGYYVRAPCPICAEEHVPEEMAPAPKRKAKVEMSLEDQLQNTIELSKQEYENLQNQFATRIEEWKQRIDDLNEKKLELEKNINISNNKEAELKEKLAKLTESRDSIQEKLYSEELVVNNLDREVTNEQTTRDEKSIRLNNLLKELDTIQ